jgi:hypothetical protein
VREILVKVCGDHWTNPEEVIQDLASSDTEQDLILDISTEGPSLYALGIAQAVLAHCGDRGREPESVMIDRWHNMAETVPFRRLHRPMMSHFFWMSERYAPANIVPSNHRYLLAYFLGRPTLPRQMIMHDVVQDLGDQVLTSMLQGSNQRSPSIDDADAWASPSELQVLDQWWQQHRIPSLDQHWLQDQYDTGCNTNADILAWYDQFDIELVAETYTLGDTFFPTEKIVRPLSAGKACLVYGPRRFLERLRDLGFRTWHDIWDEGYDQAQGADRWRQMRRVLAELAQIPRQQLSQQCRDIAVHNQQHLHAITRTYRPL